MPALTSPSYTPYETLVFFQNVAQYGSDKSSLQEISSTLNQNNLIREGVDYDATKLAPDALQFFYTQTISQQNGVAPQNLNGEASSGSAASTNGLSSSTSKSDHEHFIQDFACKLYTQFKNETIRELRQQERQYEDLEREIMRLESQTEHDTLVKTDDQTHSTHHGQPQSESTRKDDSTSAQLQSGVEVKDNDTKPIQAQSKISAVHLQNVPSSVDHAQPSPVPSQRVSTPKSASGTPVPQPAQPPSLTQNSQLHSPSTFSRTLPSPSPQRSSYGSLQPPPMAYSQHSQTQAQVQPSMLPHIQNLQRLPSHEGYPPHPRPPSQGRGSPLPQHSHSPYPQYPPYQQPHAPHGWHGLPPQPYLQHQYQPPQQYPAQIGRYPQVHTPHQLPFQPYPNTAPVPYPPPQQWRSPNGSHYHQYPASVNVTPAPRPHFQSPVFRSGGSTPWKRKSIVPGFRPRSPSQLDRDVSPLSDRDSPPPTNDPDGQSMEGPKTSFSHSGSAVSEQRSQSVVSDASEAPTPAKRRVGRPPKIKPEPPSTPALVVSDSEQAQKSSGRGGRQRARSNIGGASDPLAATTAVKRKRDAPSSSPARRVRSTSNAQQSGNPKTPALRSNNEFVIVSKTFGKTSQLLLNEITSHKLAGIFAKPLSERDAPGYKSIVHRPQDLKSIKAAVSKGSRAALVAIEELESKVSAHGADTVDTASPLPKSMSTTQLPAPQAIERTTIEGPIGNGFYLVRATEDLVPPKGIVNSSQLETELVRMFANAVVFNPMPLSGRGFGRSLKLRKKGGTLLPDGALKKKQQNEQADDQDTRQIDRDRSELATLATFSSESSSADESTEEGGIISDAREMFEDVERLVSRWKELEGEKLGASGSNQQNLGSSNERQGSISASSAAGEDTLDGESAPVTGAPGMRKRRRLGDL